MSTDKITTYAGLVAAIAGGVAAAVHRLELAERGLVGVEQAVGLVDLGQRGDEGGDSFDLRCVEAHARISRDRRGRRGPEQHRRADGGGGGHRARRLGAHHPREPHLALSSDQGGIASFARRSGQYRQHWLHPGHDRAQL